MHNIQSHIIIQFAIYVFIHLFIWVYGRQNATFRQLHVSAKEKENDENTTKDFLALKWESNNLLM